MQQPSDNHMTIALKVLKYLKGTLSFSLFYPTNEKFFLDNQQIIS